MTDKVENGRPLKGFSLFATTCGVSIGTLLIALDQYVANVSISTISGELGVSVDDGTWTITTYIVSNACSVPLTGWLTARLGRVRLFCFSALLFTFFSFLCGFAFNFPMLIVFRAFQGLVSGGLIPLSQTLLLFLYPKEKGFAMGIWGLVVMVGPAAGPVLGGWITSNISWRWIFYINIPLGLLATALTWYFLARFESERKKLPLDIIGMTLMFITVGAFQVMLDRGNDDDWWHSTFIVVLGILALVGFVFLIVWECFHPHPVIDLKLFKSRNFTLGSIAIGLGMSLVFVNMIVGPIWVQGPLGYTPLWAGYSIAAFGAAAIFLFPLVGALLHRMDTRIWIGMGFICIIPALFYLSYITIDVPFIDLAWPRFLMGVGFAFFYVPLTTISLEGISLERLPSATALFSFTRILFLSVTTSLSITYYARRENFFQERYVESIIPARSQYQLYYDHLKDHLGLMGQKADAFVYQMIKNQAYTETFLELCYIAGCCFVVLFFMIFLFKKTKSV